MVTAVLTAGWIAMLGTLAASQSVTFDYDPSARFSEYKTYAWTRGTEVPDELSHARIVRLVEGQLAAKGLARVGADEQPDVLVAYHTSFDHNLRIDAFSTGWGLGPLAGGPRSGSATVEKVLVGTLVIDIVDGRTRALVWRGMASGDVKPSDKPDQREKKLAKATDKMFRSYPPPRK